MSKLKISMACLALILAVAVPLSACAKPAPAPAKPILIRGATEFPPVELLPTILKELEATIPQETNGRAKFEFYPAATLYTQPDALVALQVGDLEMAFGGVMVGFLIPEWDVIASLPLLLDDLSHFNRFLESDAYQSLGQRMEAMGIKPLTQVYPMGIQHLFSSKEPIKSLEDFRGLKLSVPPSKVFLEAIDLLGAEAVSIPVPELPAALETGMVDATPMNSTVMPHIDLPRLVPYATVATINWFPLGLVVSTKWWNTVPPDLQQTIERIFNDAVDRWGKETLALDKRNFAVYKSAPGTVVTELTDAEKARWREALKPLYNTLKEDPNIREIIEAAEATR